ncbi:MAG: hypothetical protein H6745_21995 [Deltaproteobacteria bacterium]|nr:hypothetical protein [Deltaproteobacteria bacterium]
MPTPTTPLRRLLLALLAALPLAAACGDDGGSGSPADTATTADTADTSPADTSEGVDAVADSVSADTSAADTAVADTTPPRTTFAFEPLDPGSATPLWGAMAVGDLVVGGVDGTSKVTGDISRLSVSDGALVKEPLGSVGAARYCECAFYDAGRDELVAIGGRNKSFADAESAVVVTLATGDGQVLTDAPVADHPVGCMAFFSTVNDKGYVFGGLSSNQGAFTGKTHRWDPATRTFTDLAITGPAARYDAAVRPTDDGGALLVSGMGLGGAGVVFYRDVWRFDPTTETWSEVTPSTSTRPPGRRYAWTALSPDESVLLFGYGSDSPMGQSVVKDLWRFDLTTREWSELAVDGDLPPGRGFTPNLLIAPGDAGVLAFGTDAATKVQTDAWVLRVPDALRGRWH